MTSYFIALDQGTTGTTSLLVKVQNHQIEVVGKHTVPFQQYYPHSGWVEHDLDQIWSSVVESIECVLSESGLDPAIIDGIGITNQRETLCLFDRKSGQPMRKAIVWQCRRSSEICKLFLAEKEWVSKKTGLQIDPYFTASKLTWIKQEEPKLYAKMEKGKVVASTIDSWLLHRLTSGESFYTEPSNASRTLLMDLKTCQWDDDLLELFQVPRIALPEIKQSADHFGKTKNLSCLPDGIPILGILGDQQASLLGQGAVSAGDMKCTYGTGAFLLMNIGDQIKISENKLITTVAWSLGGKASYALEGSSFVAGAAVQFIRDEMKWIPTAESSELYAKEAVAAPHLYFVPALTGLGAPHWNADARGAFLGLSRSTDASQMVRATLEGVAFGVADLVDAMKQDAKPIQCTSMMVDGGASANRLLMQIQADLCALSIDRSEQIESTGLGAVFIALLGSGLVSELSEFKKFRKSSGLYTQNLDSAQRDQWRSGWSRALSAVNVFSKP